jgi:hypothetical protein
MTKNITGLSIKYLNTMPCKVLGQNKAVIFGRKTGRLLKADNLALESILFVFSV